MPLNAPRACQGVIGKQVKVLYYLVTVNRRATLHDAIAKVRRRGAVMTRKPGNLPVVWYRVKCPGHEELAVPKNAPMGDFCACRTFLTEGLFL